MHETGNCDAGQRVEPDDPPARSVTTGPPGETERGHYHKQIGLRSEVAEESPYPDGVGRPNDIGIVPNPEPIQDELQA